MGKESKLEKCIKDFVLEKTAEKVELYLKSEIIIKHTTRQGSILLATLWANFLQHPKNFPKEKFDYKQVNLKDPEGSSKYDELVMTAEDVTFTVVMDTGDWLLYVIWCRTLGYCGALHHHCDF